MAGSLLRCRQQLPGDLALCIGRAAAALLPPHPGKHRRVLHRQPMPCSSPCVFHAIDSLQNVSPDLWRRADARTARLARLSRGHTHPVHVAQPWLVSGRR